MELPDYVFVIMNHDSVSMNSREKSHTLMSGFDSSSEPESAGLGLALLRHC